MIPAALINRSKRVGITLATQLGAVDLTSVGVTPQGGSSANHPVTMALPFALGEFPSGSSLIAKIGSTVLPIQVEEKAYHSTEASLEYSRRDQGDASSRSVAHAVISTHIPDAIADGNSVQIDIQVSDAAPAAETQLAWSPIPVSVELDISGIVWSADISGIPSSEFTSPIKAGTGSARVQEWLAGSQCREWIVKVPFVSSSIDHAHLVARLHIRQYSNGRTRVHAIVENNWLNVAGVASYTYQTTVRVNNIVRYQDTIEHFIHSRWKVEVWDTWIPDNHIVFDTAYIVDTQMVPNYDSSYFNNLDATVKTRATDAWAAGKPSIVSGVLTLPKRDLYYSGHTQDVAAPDDPEATTYTVPHFGPMSVGATVEAAMGTTSGRNDIASLPGWTVGWLLEQSYDAYKVMMGIADGSSAWPMHYRDETTDYPASAEDNPNATVYADTGQVETCTAGGNCHAPYEPDGAHLPSFNYVPYMVTGDFFHLEEMQYWATYISFHAPASYRGYDQVLLDRANELRGKAWQLRNICHVALMTPDTHLLKGYYMRVLDNNRIEFNRVYLSDQTKTNTFGMVLDYSDNINPPWMDDYFTWACGHAVELGFISWTPMAHWKGKYTVARMGYGTDTPGFCWIFGSAYRLRIYPWVIESNTAELVTIDQGGTLEVSARKPRTMYKYIADVFTESNEATSTALTVQGDYFTTVETCNSPEQAAEQGFVENQMIGYLESEGGVAYMTPALAVAVTMGTPQAALATTRFDNRALPTDFSDVPQWAIKPRSNMRIGSTTYSLAAIAPA